MTITAPPPGPGAAEATELRPFYVDDYATLYVADARDVLPTLRTESFQLVVTDPPYGVKWRSGVRANAFAPIHGDGDDPESRDAVREVLTHCVRLTSQKRHLYVFGPTDVLEGLKVSEVTALIWDKATMGAGDTAAAWGPAHEPISFTASFHRHAGKAGNPTVPVRIRKGTVLRFPRPTGRNVRHPSEKPVPLLTELIESSSRVGDTVLDPYAGICSTGVAATLAGRRSVLVEIEPTYATVGAERLAKAAELRKQAEKL